MTSSWPAENFMARTLDVGRLLAALAPELSARRRTAPTALPAAICLETDMGATVLRITDTDVSVDEGTPPADAPCVLRLPQTELMRLALGAFPPGDLLDRLDSPPDAGMRTLVEALFPQRQPYLHLPDRI